MQHVSSNRPQGSIFAAVLGAALVGSTLLGPLAVNVAQAQTEPLTAANGVVLPSPYDDPAAARIADLAESSVAPATATTPVSPADETTATGAPEAVADAPDAASGAPEAGTSAPIVLGGADVAVSSVGGSYEVDRPSKRSERKK